MCLHIPLPGISYLLYLSTFDIRASWYVHCVLYIVHVWLYALHWISHNKFTIFQWEWDLRILRITFQFLFGLVARSVFFLFPHFDGFPFFISLIRLIHEIFSFVFVFFFVHCFILFIHSFTYLFEALDFFVLCLTVCSVHFNC